jgi:hypothetical protein
VNTIPSKLLLTSRTDHMVAAFIFFNDDVAVFVRTMFHSATFKSFFDEFIFITAKFVATNCWMAFAAYAALRIRA